MLGEDFEDTTTAFQESDDEEEESVLISSFFLFLNWKIMALTQQLASYSPTKCPYVKTQNDMFRGIHLVGNWSHGVLVSARDLRLSIGTCKENKL